MASEKSKSTEASPSLPLPAEKTAVSLPEIEFESSGDFHSVVIVHTPRPEGQETSYKGSVAHLSQIFLRPIERASKIYLNLKGIPVAVVRPVDAKINIEELRQ